MRPKLKALATRQGGVVSRRQCLAVGYTEVELRGLTAVHGPWVTVRRGVYAERDLWDQLTGWDDRARLRDRAVHLAMSTEHVMSHDSAARALGLPLLRPGLELSHITRPGVGGSRTERGVKHHLTRLPLGDTVVLDRMEVTGPARTGVDIAREHGVAAGIVTIDRVLANGTPRAALELEIATMWCWPGVRTAREAVARADAGSESVGESLTRVLLEDAGLGQAETQFPVRADGHVYWLDLLVGCHGVEFDGRQKLRSVANGGLAERPVEDLLWDERARQIAICGEGLGMSRVSWDDLFGRARQRTIERLQREYAVTVERFGTQLPAHLAEQAARIRRTAPRRRSA